MCIEFSQRSMSLRSVYNASLPFSSPKQRNLMNDKVADKANKKMGDGMARCNAAAPAALLAAGHAMPGGNSW